MQHRCAQSCATCSRALTPWRSGRVDARLPSLTAGSPWNHSGRTKTFRIRSHGFAMVCCHTLHTLCPSSQPKVWGVGKQTIANTCGRIRIVFVRPEWFLGYVLVVGHMLAGQASAASAHEAVAGAATAWNRGIAGTTSCGSFLDPLTAYFDNPKPILAYAHFGSSGRRRGYRRSPAGAHSPSRFGCFWGIPVTVVPA